MSTFLAMAILAMCPGHDLDTKGQTITNVCQERMVNCIINKAGTNEPTEKEFDSCAGEYRAKLRSGSKVSASDLE